MRWWIEDQQRQFMSRPICHQLDRTARTLAQTAILAATLTVALASEPLSAAAASAPPPSVAASHSAASHSAASHSAASHSAASHTVAAAPSASEPAQKTSLEDPSPAVVPRLDWTRVPQLDMAGHPVREPEFAAFLRRIPIWLWTLLLCPPLWLVAWRRHGQRRRRRTLVWALLLSTATMAIAGVLLHRVVRALYPPPAILRGEVVLAPIPAVGGRPTLYAWGESTMHGDVFAPDLTIPKVVQWALDGPGGTHFEVQNLGEPGTSLSLRMPTQLFPIFDEPERYHPAGLLIYVGHNEFWNARQHAGLRALWWERHPEAELAEVEGHYARSMRLLAERAKAAGVPLFLALPTSNIEGFPPVAPRHGSAGDGGGDRTGGGDGDAVSDAAKVRFEGHLDAALLALKAGDGATALDHARAAEAASPGHAWGPFVVGRALRQLGRAVPAHAAFRRALVLDYDRQRALPSQNARLRQLCAEGLAHCVDASAALRVASPWLDDDAFIDLHHPNARGHALIGLAFARSIAKTLKIRAPRSLPTNAAGQIQWPTNLDPSARMRVRYLQTFAWHLTLPMDLRQGYKRSRLAVLDRAERQLAPLRAALPRLPAAEAQRLRIKILRGELMIALLRGDVPAAKQFHDRLWRLHDWKRGPPVRDRRRRALLAEVLGDGALAP